MIHIEDYLYSKNIDIMEINPYVRYMQLIMNQYNEHFVPKRQLYNFLLLYVIDGEMDIDFSDSSYILKSSDFVIIPPKYCYKESIPNNKFCKYYVMDFDMVYFEERKWWDRKELYLKYCRREINEASFKDNLVSEKDLNFFLFKKPIIIQNLNTTKILEILKNMLDLFEKNFLQEENLVTRFSLKSNILTILSSIFESEDLYKKANSNPFVSKFIEYTIEHYSEKLNMDQIAKDIGYSPNYFRTIFKQEMGVTPYNYLLQYRIKIAKELLSKGFIVREVSGSVGFENEFYFSKVFKKYVGKSPKTYKKQFTVTI